MGNEIYNTMTKSMYCTRNCRPNKKKQKLGLFPLADYLEYVNIDNLGPLPKPGGGSKYIVVISDRYSKLIKASPTTNTTATRIINIFMERYTYNFGVPSTVLTDNGLQFTCKFFPEICNNLAVKTVTATE